jgi:hypothetical protein
MMQSLNTMVSLPLPNNIHAPEFIQTRDNRKLQPDYHSACLYSPYLWKFG